MNYQEYLLTIKEDKCFLAFLQEINVDMKNFGFKCIKLNDDIKSRIQKIQQKESIRESERKRAESIDTKKCAYCGGRVRCYAVGEDGYAIECDNCDTLFDED